PVPAYLEVIAIDPAAPAPGRPRWFGLDDPAVAASLAGGPRPLTWQVRPAAGVDAALAALAAAGVDAGAAMALARDDLRWRLSVRDDGAATLGGACPVVIEWAPGLILPPERLPPSGLTLQHIALSPPPGDEAALAAALAALGADGLAEVAPPGRPAVTATLATPAGAVTLA
ncbi:MAG: VOC family protein, partial [Pseudomonadota bacterium]